MCPRQESNLYLRLRRSPFYPLNYGGRGGRDCDMASAPCRLAALGVGPQFQRQVQIKSSARCSPDCSRTVTRCAAR